MFKNLYKLWRQLWKQQGQRWYEHTDSQITPDTPSTLHTASMLNRRTQMHFSLCTWEGTGENFLSCGFLNLQSWERVFKPREKGI